jgi:alpha-amylase/alpha-mannosidase (GH57 family)
MLEIVYLFRREVPRMAVLRVVVLWHQHQPFYKDLVTGSYRLPWVRLHALKDYYGMVKLLDEFPNVHQTFNLVPSLITQIQDYVAGTARDPFQEVAAKPAKELTSEERRFALQYLFQANPVNVIGRYPRYRQLWERFRKYGSSPKQADVAFDTHDFTDLQVLSQIAWFDEFFLQEKDIAELVRKERNYSLDDQKFIFQRERELVARVLPAHAEAAARGGIEISTSPFYHPILPLVCDTNQGAASSQGLPLPQHQYRRPEDAREQLLRGLDLHQEVFGVRPQGVWPSEGSVSEEAISVAHLLGVNWMATDEGVLGRSLNFNFARDGGGRLCGGGPERLYTLHRYEKDNTRMNMLFRDHTMSDLIGFVYSGMAPGDAAQHLINNIRHAAQPVLDQGRDAVVPIILDGENAWEYYPASGREFLRRFYDALQNSGGIEAVTVSEAIARHQHFSHLGNITPGSWIGANFNVWIGAPEDNKAWDYLHAAREFYEQNASRATAEQRKLAYEEILIAEGSDWNWWYGPEHHSENDRDFDELYRKHLANVYHALGAMPPEYLVQPITASAGRPAFIAQMGYIRPRIDGEITRYFEWIGAAMYTADLRAGAMHGKQFFLDAVYAGVDEQFLYGRLDFAGGVPDMSSDLVVNVESYAGLSSDVHRVLRVDAGVEHRSLQDWSVTNPQSGTQIVSAARSVDSLVQLALKKVFEFRLPLEWLRAPMASNGPQADRLRMRISLWHDRLPIDALPVEGWIELQLLSEEELMSGVAT